MSIRGPRSLCFGPVLHPLEPFDRDTDGRFVAYVQSSEISGDTASVVVRVLDVSSGLFDTLRTNVELIPVTADLAREAIEGVRARLGDLGKRMSYTSSPGVYGLPVIREYSIDFDGGG